MTSESQQLELLTDDKRGSILGKGLHVLFTGVSEYNAVIIPTLIYHLKEDLKLTVHNTFYSSDEVGNADYLNNLNTEYKLGTPYSSVLEVISKTRNAQKEAGFDKINCIINVDGDNINNLKTIALCASFQKQTLLTISSKVASMYTKDKLDSDLIQSTSSTSSVAPVPVDLVTKYTAVKDLLVVQSVDMQLVFNEFVKVLNLTISPPTDKPTDLTTLVNEYLSSTTGNDDAFNNVIEYILYYKQKPVEYDESSKEGDIKALKALVLFMFLKDVKELHKDGSVTFVEAVDTSSDKLKEITNSLQSIVEKGTEYVTFVNSLKIVAETVIANEGGQGGGTTYKFPFDLYYADTTDFLNSFKKEDYVTKVKNYRACSKLVLSLLVSLKKLCSLVKEATLRKDKNVRNAIDNELKRFQITVNNIDRLMQGKDIPPEDINNLLKGETNPIIADEIKAGRIFGNISPSLSQNKTLQDMMKFFKIYPILIPLVDSLDDEVNAFFEVVGADDAKMSDPHFINKIKVNSRIMEAYVYEINQLIDQSIGSSFLPFFEEFYKYKQTAANTQKTLGEYIAELCNRGYDLPMRKAAIDADLSKEGNEATTAFFKGMFSNYMTLLNTNTNKDISDFFSRIKLLEFPEVPEDPYKFRNVYVPTDITTVDAEDNAINGILEAARAKLRQLRGKGMTDNQLHDFFQYYGEFDSIEITGQDYKNHLNFLKKQIEPILKKLDYFNNGTRRKLVYVKILSLYLVNWANSNFTGENKTEFEAIIRDIFRNVQLSTDTTLPSDISTVILNLRGTPQAGGSHTPEIALPVGHMMPLYKMILSNLLLYFDSLQRVVKKRVFKAKLKFLEELHFYKEPEKYIIPYYFVGYTDVVLTSDKVIKSMEATKELTKQSGGTVDISISFYKTELKRLFINSDNTYSHTQYICNALDYLKKQVVEKYKSLQNFSLKKHPLVLLVDAIQRSDQGAYSKIWGTPGSIKRTFGEIGDAVASAEGGAKPAENLNALYKEINKIRTKGFTKGRGIMDIIDKLRKTMNVSEVFPDASTAFLQELNEDILLYSMFIDDLKDKRNGLFKAFFTGNFANKKDFVDAIGKASTSFIKHLNTLSALQANYELYASVKNNADSKFLLNLENPIQYYSNFKHIIKNNQVKFKDIIAKFLKHDKVAPYMQLYGWLSSKADIMKFLEEGDFDIPESIVGGSSEWAKQVQGYAKLFKPTVKDKAIKDTKSIIAAFKEKIGYTNDPPESIIFDQGLEEKKKADIILAELRDKQQMAMLQGAVIVNEDTISKLLQTLLTTSADTREFSNLIGGDFDNLPKYFLEDGTIVSLDDTMNVIQPSGKAEEKKEDQKQAPTNDDPKDPNDSKDPNDPKDPKDPKDPSDPKGPKDPIDPKGPKEEGEETIKSVIKAPDGTCPPGAASDESDPIAVAKRFKNKTKMKMEQRIKDNLDFLEMFIKLMEAKYEKWITDIAQMGKREMAIIDEAIKTYYEGQKENNLSKIKTSRNIVQSFCVKLTKALRKKSSNYFLFVKNFYLKDARKKIREINQYIERYSNIEIVEEEQPRKQQGGTDVIPKGYVDIVKRFEDLNTRFDKLNDSYFIKLSEFIGDYLKESTFVILDDDVRVKIIGDIDDIESQIGKYKAKLKSYYTLNYSMLDVLFDTQFIVMYVIKAIRIGFTYLALFLTTKVFTPIYEETVYDKKENPPSLVQFLGIYLGFDLAFNVFIFIVLFLLKFLFKTDDNAFAIDKYLFYKYLTDYVISMVYVFLIALLVAQVIMNKKYFKYKYEGLRAIRAYQDIVFYIALFVFVFPYFWMF